MTKLPPERLTQDQTRTLGVALGPPRRASKQANKSFCLKGGVNGAGRVPPDSKPHSCLRELTWTHRKVIEGRPLSAPQAGKDGKMPSTLTMEFSPQHKPIRQVAPFHPGRGFNLRASSSFSVLVLKYEPKRLSTLGLVPVVMASCMSQRECWKFPT